MAPSATANTVFLALKGLAIVAEIAMLAAVVYGGATMLRYWPHISV